jgi:heme exporter protein B
MIKATLIQIIAVMMKDLRSEFRTRYAISAISLFVLVTITMIVFSFRGETINSSESSGLLWITFFFGSMMGLSKTFVSEEERQTSLFLKMCLPNIAVYFGKLLFNIILAISINLLASLLFYLFIGLSISSVFIFLLIILLGGFGIGSSSTIISAIISKADSKGAIFPILSFPVLLPLIIIGIESTTMSLSGSVLSDVTGNLLLLLSYSGILIPISFILFDFVWED